jgi:hypothetical protein
VWQSPLCPHPEFRLVGEGASSGLVTKKLNPSVTGFCERTGAAWVAFVYCCRMPSWFHAYPVDTQGVTRCRSFARKQS